ncbi:metallophosphoesterase [Arsukibacterium sp.]|uniref:metallophosphoesterase n=1 Tax=Arsukibacterium sp. TaxID=1977258 RepID=UPI002FD9DCDA
MSPYLFPPKASYRIVQISDCHLLAGIDELYQGVRPGRYLQQAVARIQQSAPDALLLTGDLSQDHSVQSYQLLTELLQGLSCPIFLLPGNHDDRAMLAAVAEQAPCHSATALQLGDWQLLLLDTKGPTPAGEFCQQRRQALQSEFMRSRAGHFWLFCHHHPRPLGWSIDRHGLAEPELFWQLLGEEPRVRGLAHGHCHYAYAAVHQHIQLVGCPASSVQFLATADWQTVDQGPQWCQWQFTEAGKVSWQFCKTG